MTDRSERGPRGRKPGPRRPGMGGRPPKPDTPRHDDREKKAPARGKEGAAARPDGRPHSKRFGRRPPGSVRKGAGAARSERPAKDGERPRSAAGFARGGDRRFRTDRPLRGDPDRGARREIGRGPDRASKRGRKAEEGIDDGRIRLNRFLSNAGVASRRDADDLIKAGVVTVNGKIVTELGTKVSPTDVVHYGGQKLSTEKKRYVLVNKPKDFITTTEDPRDRRTVMALIDDACTERLYPVGRLDRNTTGLLLMTNDGDLAKKLTHPSHGAEKIYHVTLDKNVTKADLDQLVKGVPLDDGPAQADEARYVDGASKREVGLKLHMGRNRVVRRMFEAMGYEVLKLDRVVFAGLTKKDLPRGNWRHLTEKEVLFLSKRK
ncbi:MAG: pseudouridine synthase [Flavobacteriales bacterium]|nr:pseudouridine synthase [Flavobacteriales bacterium]